MLSKNQTAKNILSSDNNCLLFDGTSKDAFHYLSFNLASSTSGVQLADLTEVVTEDASTLLDSTKGMFDKMAELVVSDMYRWC